MFRTQNPAMKPELFAPAQTWEDLERSGRAGAVPGAPSVAKPTHMTIQGAVNKTALLLGFCILSAIVAWNLSFSHPGLSTGLWIGGALGGFVLFLITLAKPSIAIVTGPLYAIAEGLFVGSISSWYATRFAAESGALNSGLIINAGLLTFGICAGLLAAYSFRIIRPGRMFRNVTITLTIGLLLYTLIAFIGSMFLSDFALASVYDPSNGGAISIGFSLFVVALASANLVLDFQLIEEGAANRAPKHMEWYGAFAVLATIVWMYVAILKLLAKLQSRD